MISAGRACQLLVPPSFLCFLVTLFFSRTLIPVTCLRKVRITENPNHGSCLYPTNMVRIHTLLLVEASCWSCLCWSSSFWSLTSSPRAPHLTVARYDAVRLFINIMYLNVFRSLCCFFLLGFSCFKHVHLWQNIQPCRAQVLASPSSWGSATLPRVSTRWAGAAFRRDHQPGSFVVASLQIVSWMMESASENILSGTE